MESKKILIGMLIGVLVVIIFILAWAPWTDNKAVHDKISQEKQTENYKDLPSKVQELKEKIQKKKPDEIYNITMTLFGYPDRNVGSGISVLEWDVEGGVLVLSAGYGEGRVSVAFRSPIFICNKTKKSFWLIDTKNKLGENLVGGYEMTTTPNKYGTMFWLGNLDLYANGTYKYRDSSLISTIDSLRGQQKDNFFINNPTGRYRITYGRMLTKEMILESLDNDTVVATLEFQSDKDTKISETFTVYVDTNSRVLFFGKGQYYLYKAWNDDWNYE